MRTTIRRSLLPALAAASLAASGCGSDDVSESVTKKSNEVQQQAQDQLDSIKGQADDFQAQAQQIAADVKSGKITSKQGEARIKKLTSTFVEQSKDAQAQLGK